MKKLYKNILNEVFQVYDFDSWDNTEQSFKNDKINELKDKTFIYKKDELSFYEDLQIFSSNSFKSCAWPLYKEYVDSGKVIITLEGKRVKLHEGSLKGKWTIGNIYLLEITGLDGIENARNMFHACDIVKVPLFDTSKCIDMSRMFEYCNALEKVPLFNMDSVKECKCMLAYCDKLKKVPCFSMPRVKNMTGMLEYCVSLESVPKFKNLRKDVNMNRIFFGISFELTDDGDYMGSIRGTGKLDEESIKIWTGMGYNFDSHTFNNIDFWDTFNDE